MLQELEKEAKQTLRTMQGMLTTARKEKRGLTDKEQDEYDDLDGQYNILIDQISNLRNGDQPGESTPPTGLNRPGPVGERWEPGGEVITRSADRLFPTGAPRRSNRVGRAVLDFIRGKENRDLNTAGATAILQNPKIQQEIFLSLEANNPLTKLGAQILNVDNYSSWPVVTTPPTIAWVDESDTLTPDSAMVIGSKKITFRNAAALLKIHRFTLEDSAVDSAQLVQSEIIRAIRREMLRVVFHGDNSSKEPDGLDNISGVQSLSGATFANYDPIIEAYAAVMAEDSPLENIGAVFGVNTWERLTKLADQQDNPMIVPPAFGGSKGWHYTSVISESFGTTPHLTRGYVGDFSNLRIGFSGPFSLQLMERYADSLNYAVLVYFRLDLQAIRPANFCRIESIPII
ncbi:MAG: phage major capsid protein [Saprospiraceae bacterium]|nr:phage major capsid protein [Saprospiraceae bacterium]